MKVRDKSVRFQVNNSALTHMNSSLDYFRSSGVEAGSVPLKIAAVEHRCNSGCRRHYMNNLVRSSLYLALTGWFAFGFANSATAQGVSVARSAPANKFPKEIKERKTANFFLRSDLGDEEAKELLDRLEKMIRLVSKYYGRANSQIIELNVISSFERWPEGSIPAEAMGHVRAGGGITFSLTEGIQNELGEKQITKAKSVVWAIATGGVPQHEAVHAFCHQSFGRTGPTWYSEGMAELGKYWRDNDDGVHIDALVLRYLKSTRPRELVEITSKAHTTGDSWQNYSWRWALCHLLSTNPNYAARFKPLGMALLNDRDTDFDDVYGSMSKEIEFEYRFFLEHLDQGFRCDLCAWDWKSKAQRVRGSNTMQSKIAANRGWQTSRVALKRGDKISIVATGEWTIEKDGSKISPDGDEVGHAGLAGILFDDYQLSPPFLLGQECTYEATADGILMLRCDDHWNKIDDNSGTITVKIKAVND